MSKPQLRIGQVCDLLKAEFPDISISKLRFLEEQELVTPERTAGGYRMYTEQHVRELRHILQMQRDQFLPLRVIREELQRRMAAGSDPVGTVSAAARRAGSLAGSGRVSLAAPEEYTSLRELCDRAQVTPQFVEECRGYDLVSGVRGEDGDPLFSAEEAAIVRAASQMARLGIDVRNLRQVRSAVGRNAALVEQFAAARLRAKNADDRAAALRSVEQLTELLSDFMRSAIVRDVRTMTARAGEGAPGAVGGAGAEQLARYR